MQKIALLVGTVLIIGGVAWSVMQSGTAPTPTSDIASAVAQDLQPQSTTTQPQQPTQPQTPAPVTPNPEKIMQATLHTSMGDITFGFLPEVAPHAVENFVKLAQEGFYDGTKFHRIIKGFMNQGGDPLSKDDSQKANWGRGGPGYSFADEITSASRNDAGMVAMANSGPNTNGSQFYINAANNNFLDGKYTVFAKVVSGMDVVMKMNAVSTDSSDKPLQPVVLQSVSLK